MDKIIVIKVVCYLSNGVVMIDPKGEPEFLRPEDWVQPVTVSIQKTHKHESRHGKKSKVTDYRKRGRNYHRSEHYCEVMFNKKEKREWKKEVEKERREQ